MKLESELVEHVFRVPHSFQYIATSSVESAGTAMEDQGILRWLWKPACLDHFRAYSPSKTIPFSVLCVIVPGQRVENFEILVSLCEFIDFLLGQNIILCLVREEENKRQ